MFNFHRVLRPFAGFLSTLVMCVSVAAEDCPDLMDVHNLLLRIDNQTSGQDTLACSDGPLKPNKSGYGFVLREPENDITLAKLYALENSFNIEFVQIKPTKERSQ